MKILATLHMVGGPIWSSNHNRKMPGIMRLLEVYEKRGLVSETAVEIVPQRPKQVFSKHPRNRSGESLSPLIQGDWKGKSLIFHASDIFPSSNGRRGCFKCHLDFLISGMYVEGVGLLDLECLVPNCLARVRIQAQTSDDRTTQLRN